MKKLLLGSVLAIALMVPAASDALAGYSAVAVGPYGGGSIARHWQSMEAARSAAVGLCRDLGGGSCSTTTAERDNWYFSIGFCNGVPYTAASPQGWDRSNQLVRLKGAADDNYDCTIETME